MVSFFMVSRQQLKKEATKEMILKNAEELFSEKGYDKTTINEIVEKSNLAKGTFYYHFETKEDLIVALSYKEFHENFENFKDSFSENTSGIEILNSFIEKMCQWCIDNPQKLKIILSQRLDLQSRLKTKKMKSSSTFVFSYIISIGQKQGIITGDISSEELGAMLSMMIAQAQIRWIASEGNLDLEKNFKNCLTIFLNGAMLHKKGSKR